MHSHFQHRGLHLFYWNEKKWAVFSPNALDGTRQQKNWSKPGFTIEIILSQLSAKEHKENHLINEHFVS